MAISFWLLAVLIVAGFLLLSWILSLLPPKVQEFLGDFLRESFK